MKVMIELSVDEVIAALDEQLKARGVAGAITRVVAREGGMSIDLKALAVYVENVELPLKNGPFR